MKLFGILQGAGKPRPLGLKLLLWTLVVGALVGVSGIGDSFERMLWSSRNLLRSHSASQHIVLVGIDDKSLSRVRSWPWPRHEQAALARNLFRMGADRVFFDIDFSSPSDPQADRELADAFAPYGKRVVLAARFFIDPTTGARTDVLPLPMLTRTADVANINFPYAFDGSVWRLPYTIDMHGQPCPSFSALLAKAVAPRQSLYRVDFSINPRSVPRVSAIDVLDGKVPASTFAGRDIVVGVATDQIQDMYIAPGRGRLPGAYFHIIGAETLRSGLPINLGWILAFSVAAAIAIGCAFIRRAMPVILILSAAALGLLLLPFVTEPAHITVDIVASLIMLLVQISTLSWREVRRMLRDRATTNAISGLQNLNALRLGGDLSQRVLVVARVHNFAEAISTLPVTAEKMLVAQIASRLTLGGSQEDLYQGDDGVFAWFTGGEIGSIGEHLEALHAVFRSPVLVADQTLDLVVTFGVDMDYERSVSNRLGSALVAAGEAAEDGGKWKQFDTTKLKDAAWKLSLLSQLDAAIDGGDLWVAYQPKLRLSDKKIIGAEALVRWTHPEKGNISPVEFVAAAEQNNRIEKLTSHVLDRAILAAATINGHGIPFNIAVNLSARLLEEPGLGDAIVTLLTKHGLSADHLTLEITETAALTSAQSLEILHDLRRTGISISIDDYGTGLSTLEYLKKIPASEIKIDKSFVQAMGNSASDLLMVNSTIQLAHSLGHKVVAEGVETEETLERLIKLDCDTAQGFYIGRPMTFQALARRLVASERQVA